MSPALRAQDRVLTTEKESALAKDVLDDLRGADRALSVERHGEHLATLPPEVGVILQHVLDVMAKGGTVTVSAVPEILTTSAAAGILGISRPTLMKMIADGVVPSHMVGSHHRLAAEDVFAVKRARRDRERAAFNELRDIDERLE